MSERISFQCQHYGKSLSAKAKYAGRSGKCKGCGLSITVPQAGAQTPKSDSFKNELGGLSRVPNGMELSNFSTEASLFVLDFCKKLESRLFDEEFFSFDPADQKQLLDNCLVQYRESFDELIGNSGKRSSQLTSAEGLQTHPVTNGQEKQSERPNFQLVKREHVIEALSELDQNTDHGSARSTKYFLRHEEKSYSPKAVLGVAYKFATGFIIGPSDFSGGNQPGQANHILKQLLFDIVTIEELESSKEPLSDDNPVVSSQVVAAREQQREAGELGTETHSFELPESFEHFQLDRKLEILRDAFTQEESSHWLPVPISALTKESDRHLPQAFLGHRIGDFLKLSLYQIQREPGVGDTKIHRLFTVLSRGLTQKPDSAEPGSGGVPQVQQHSSLNLTAIDSVKLATLADSLGNISSGLRDLNVSDLAGKSSAQLQDIPGVGASKAEEIETQLANIKRSLQCNDESGIYSVQVQRRDVAKIERWCFETADSAKAPEAVEFQMNFVVPLLKIVENDFDTEMRHIVQGRIGLNEPPKTLKELGEEYDLTRERIRQKLIKVVEAIKFRFPKGKTLLSLVAARAGNSIENSDLNKLIRECRSAFFDTERESEQSAARPSAKEILSAWSRLGREHQTPFSHAELLQWIADEFPGVVDNFAMELILSDSLMTQLPNGNRIFLTNRVEDRAYAHLLNHSGMIQLSQLAEELDAMERSLNASLASDQRVAMDDDHNVVLLEDIGFKRLEGKWFLNLAPIQDSPDLDNEVIIPLETLVNSVLTGLPGKDIYDATVWGVYRYLSELLEYEYRSAFPLGIDAIILADILVAHSDGRIRNMRRRRLRWDDEEAPVALGKIGWVGVCVTKSNLAITVDELDSLLQETYQDYADYVLEQLDTNEPEEGSDGVKFEVVKVPRSGLPLIVTPANERADSAFEHCSLMVSGALNQLSSMEIYKIQQLGNKWLNRELSGTESNGTALAPQREEAIVTDEVLNAPRDDDEDDVEISFENEELTDYADIPESSVPMIEAVFKLLLEEGEPMRIGRIRQQLNERDVKIPGQGKDANIIVYLRKSKDFCRTAVGTYALSQWGLQTIDKPKTVWKKSSWASKANGGFQYNPEGVNRLLDAVTDPPKNDRPMQIYEAAHKVLGECGEPTHISRIRELVESQGYFRFGAQDPEGALRVAIDRHANNVEISKPAEPKLFYRHAPATYGLIEWQVDQTPTDASVDSSTNPQVVIAAMDAETWFGLSHWAKVNDQLQPKERSLAYSIGKVLSQGNMPSPKQAKWAVDILRRAKAEGFNSSLVETDTHKPSIEPPKSDLRTDSVNDVLASFILGE